MLRPHGGYRNLRSFQVSEIVYDATVAFCDRFIDKRSRTHDQMVQAARSGRQNIAEGSRAAGTSSQTELRLVGVARASLDELLLDYEDFLRQRRLPLWGKDDPRAKNIREIGVTPAGAPGSPRRANPSVPTDPSDSVPPPETPTCPKCDLAMILRTARKGTRVGSQFWGCPSYPDCTDTIPFKQPT